MIEIALTKFQAEEIGGLLDNVSDQNDIATSDEDRMIVWGEMSGTRSKRSVIVLDVAVAIDELQHRSEFMIQESDEWGPSNLGGYAGARSLRLVIDKMEAASR